MNPSASTDRERAPASDHKLSPWHTGVVGSGSGAADDEGGMSAVINRVAREHATIRALLDEVGWALDSTRTDADAGLARLRSAVWALRLMFEAHVDFEEAELSPLLQRRDSGNAMAAVAMVLDHNEQRRILCELVEDLESDVLELDAVWARTTALVGALRRDVAAEDRLLST